MSHSLSRVWVHLVWSTKRRTPWLDPRLDPLIRALYATRSAKLGAELLAFGAFDDHVHLAIRLPLTRSIADVVCAYKSESAHWIVRALDTREFRWQTGYGAFSIDPDQADALFDYIEHQRSRHADAATHSAWEKIERADESLVAPIATTDQRTARNG